MSAEIPAMNRSFRHTALAAALALLTLSTQSWGDPPAKKFLTPDGTRPTGLFAPGVMVGKTVYIAGKGDYKPQEEIQGKVRNCLNEVRKSLQAAGMDLANVVHSFCYIEDRTYAPEFDKAYAELFPKNPPARTLVCVPNVPGDSRIEITCIAYADPSEVRPIGKPSPDGTSTPGIIAGDMAYFSGMDDRRKDGSHPESFRDRMKQAMKNTESALKDAGLGFGHAVMMHVFIDDPKNYGAAMKVYGTFFKKGSEPALAVVPVDWIPGDSRVLVTCWAVRDLTARKVVRTDDPSGIFTLTHASPAVWAGDTLYLSAFEGSAKSVSATPDDVGAQVRLMAERDRTVLGAAGLGFEHIVSGHVYLKTIDDYTPMNNVYKEYYSAGPGVRTCLMPMSNAPGPVKVRASFIAARTK